MNLRQRQAAANSHRAATGPFAEATPTSTGPAPFWRQVMGDWWRPKGPVGGAGVDMHRGGEVEVPLATQGVTTLNGTGLFLPMRRQTGGMVVVRVEDLEQMPVTAYPLLLPRIFRSALQPLSMIRTQFQLNVAPVAVLGGGPRTYPFAPNANTRAGERWKHWRIIVPAPLGGAGAKPATRPMRSRQPGYQMLRSTLRVPRYSTIPRTVPVKGPSN